MTGSRFSTDERGVSELLGSMLLFGLLVSVLVLMQANAVPTQNQRIEFEHNQRIQGQWLRVDEDIETTAVDGRKHSTVVEMGTSYPPRFIFFNPPPAAGTLSSEAGIIRVQNAQANQELGDYWDGSNRTFSTQRLVYRPGYNEYDNAPRTVLSNGIVYNHFPQQNATRKLDSGSPIRGTRISLIAIGGADSSTRVAPKSLSIVPASAPTRTVRITDTGSPITLTITTALPASEWRNILEPQLVANGGHVTNVSDGAAANTVAIELERNITYELAISKVSLDTTPSPTPPHYITRVERNGTSVTVDERKELTVEVRDRFNAPESNVTVSFSSSGGTFEDATVTTDSAGRATAVFSSNSTGTKTVNATADLDDSGTIEARERATFTVQVGQDGRVNPMRFEHFGNGHTVNITLEKANASGSAVDITLNNTAGADREIVQARLTMYYNPQSPPIARGDFEGTTLEVGGKFVAIDPALSVPAGTTSTFTLDNLVATTGQSEDPDSKDYVIITIIFDNGQIARYHFQPE